jgi:predicted  nucleic acid-binding Zn-ribbon protein
MTEETENIVLELLRRVRGSQERSEADLSDLKLRMSAVEIQVSALNSRFDRFDERLTRIERRLDLADA